MPIDVFNGPTSGAPNHAEKLVLGHVLSILEARDEDAVVIVNMLLKYHEVDLVVATETATLVIEVKGYTQAIAGLKNERTWRMAASGNTLEKNFSAQVDSASLELKDTLRKETGRDPGYARAVLLFAYGIPSGSTLPRSDHRVTIVGIEALEGLLCTPIAARSKRRVWSPDLIRWFAQKHGLAPMRRPAIELVPIDETEYEDVPSQSTTPATPAKLYSAVPRVIELQAAPVFVPAPNTYYTPNTYTRKRSRSRALLLSAITLFVLGGGLSAWLRQPITVSSKVASATHRAHEPLRRHAMTEAARDSARIKRAKEESGDAAALLQAQQANLQIQTARLNQQAAPAVPLPPCPPGIDRLGCVPDPQTLAKLRGD